MIHNKQIVEVVTIPLVTDGISLEYEVVHNLGIAIDELQVRVLDGDTSEEVYINVAISNVDVMNNIRLVGDVAYPIGDLLIQIR